MACVKKPMTLGTREGHNFAVSKAIRDFHDFRDSTASWGGDGCAVICRSSYLRLSTAAHSAFYQESAAILSPVGYQQGCELDLHVVSELRIRAYSYTSPLLQLSHGVLLNLTQGRRLYH
jgi:hypothetical protein